MGSWGDAEVVEEGLHADAEGLVVPVDWSPDGGLASDALLDEPDPGGLRLP